MKETINQRITKYRRFRGYTQAEMAERLGMKSSTYSQCERIGKISCDLIVALSKILNVDVKVLLLGEDVDVLPPPPQHDFTLMEKNIIKIIRNLKNQDRKELISIIENFYKKSQ